MKYKVGDKVMFKENFNEFGIIIKKGFVSEITKVIGNHCCIEHVIGVRFEADRFELIEEPKIDDEWLDIDIVRYVEKNLQPEFKDYKKQYYYKNQNVEEMYQKFLNIEQLEKRKC